MFRRVLIANRGEIAARVIRTCRELGVETVAVYSEADADSPHLDLADQRICIGPAHASASYLDQDAILAAAHQRGCQAIHPGYGFLSENALFATRCRQEQIAFIGPRPHTIRQMGDKVAARRAATAAGLPIIPGSGAPCAEVAAASEVAARLGYPVLVKAAAGGGGKGMRIVREPRELASLFVTAGAEAGAAFGDDRLYVEKLIEHGRHIEFQVLADDHGNVVHLFERECSVQRNHQKLVEETPSPALPAARADAFGAQVAAAVRAIGYQGAGTVEFLLDPASGELYFLEMNTRLQVEHAITEMTTGIDLVAWQLRIAAGEVLGLRQDQIRRSGHSIECRINAEDPARGFQPGAGRIDRLVLPPASAHVRIDTHVREGYVVPPFYDSLIAKVIVGAEDRAAAIARMESVLAGMSVSGIPTTIALHRRVLASAAFRAGRYDTASLPALLAEGGN